MMSPWQDDQFAMVQTEGTLILRDSGTGKVNRRLRLLTWDGKSPRTFQSFNSGETPYCEEITKLSISRDKDRVLYQIDDIQTVLYSVSAPNAKFFPRDKPGDDPTLFLIQFIPGDKNRLLAKQSFLGTEPFGGGINKNRSVVVDAQSLKVLQTFGGPGEVDEAFPAPDGKHVVTVQNQERGLRLKLWEIGRTDPVAASRSFDWKLGDSFDFLSHVSPACFSPDGAHFLIGGDDARIHVINIDSFQETAVLVGHVGKIKSVVFAADGKHFASLGWGDVVLIWRSDRVFTK